MGNVQAIIVEHIKCIARRFTGFFSTAVGLYACNEDTTDFIFPRACNFMRGAFYSAGEIMSRGIVTDSHNIRPQLEGLIPNYIAIKSIRHHRRHTALGETKAGMPVPGNFHDVESPP